MEGGVLAHIKSGRVETEDRKLPQDGGDEIVGQRRGTGGAEGAGEHVEIGLQVGRFLIDMRGVRCVARDEDFLAHQQGCGAPWLLVVLAEQGGHIGSGAAIDFRREAFEHHLEFGRHLLEMFAERQVMGEPLELAGKQSQGIVAQCGEGVARHLGGDARVAIAVAADPGSEADHRWQFVQCGGIEARLAPGLAQVGVGARDRLGKHLAEVEERVVEFLGDAGAGDVDFPGAPEGFELGFQEMPATGAFAVGEGRVFALLHQVVNLAVAFAHGFAFGLGGVGGEHRLHAHGGEGVQQRGGIQPEGAHFSQFVRPEAFFGSRAVGFLAPAAGLGGHPFLHDVEQLEGDGIRLAQRPVRAVGSGQRVSAPWQLGGQFTVPKATEHAGKGIHREPQLGIEQLESVVQKGGVLGHGRR